MAKKKKKPTFKELYEAEKAKPTAAAQFIADTAAALNKSETTIRMWLCGASKPNKDIVEKVERHFGSDIKTLFPNYEK